MKKVAFSITTSGADIQRKIAQIKKFLEKGEVQVSVQAKRGQGRIFDMAHGKLTEIAAQVEGKKTVPTKSKNGFLMIIRA